MNFFEKIIKLQQKVKHHLFEMKIEKRNKHFERKQKRKMDEDEIKDYKFYLFTCYSLILVVPFILLFSMR